MKINMKSVLKALAVFGIGATAGHITQVIHDCEIADPEDFNALGRFSMKVCKYWKTIGDGFAEAKEEIKEEPEETTVEEADDEWDAWPNVMHLDDLLEKEEPSE